LGSLLAIVSRHLLKDDILSDAGPQQIIDLLRPCLHSLTRANPARPPAE